LLLLRDQAVTENSHEAFWKYRLSYFGKVGLLSYRIRLVVKKIRDVLCPKRLQLACARYLTEHSVKEFQNKLERKVIDTNTTGGASSLHKYGLLLHRLLSLFVRYVICFLLGFVTFGVFWTEDIRKWVFYSSSNVQSNELEMIQKETESLVQANQKMVQLQAAQSQQIVVLREENMQQSKHIADIADINHKQSEQMVQQSKHIADMNQTLTKLTKLMEQLLEDTSSARRIATAVEDSTVR
jgi:ATP-dependent Lon protease